MTTKPIHRLTLKDRLSRLTFTQACKLLGEEGRQLIRQGGIWEINLAEQVYLEGDLFRLKLEDAVVTITLMAAAKDRLHWNCTACQFPCVHAGAAFSLLLEEKTALGLAAPPPERIPVESLSERELIDRALADRDERSRKERFKLQSHDPQKPWTDYTITSTASGKTYRVALRGHERGISYCSCPDFRTNTLSTASTSCIRCGGPRRSFRSRCCAGPTAESTSASISRPATAWRCGSAFTTGWTNRPDGLYLRWLAATCMM